MKCFILAILIANVVQYEAQTKNNVQPQQKKEHLNTSKSSETETASGFDVITAMHKAYKGGKWYRHFTFSQETNFYRNDSLVKTEVWHEASSSPGKLLIKFKTKDSPNGVIFADKKVHIFKENEKPRQRAMVHELTLTAFDVYFLEPKETCRLLDSLGFNLKIARKEKFENRNVWVIGAEKNDSISNQIWIDAERFYLHRLIHKQGSSLMDVILSDYKEMKAPGKKFNYYVATKVIFKVNGKLNMNETYYDIKFPNELPADYFNPDKFNSIKLE